MKAIITELKNGYKTYMVFDSEKVYEVFSKIVKTSGNHYVHGQEEFDELKDDWFPFELKMFQGRGVYTSSGEFLGETMIDSEDGTKYSIQEEYSQSTDKIKMIDPLKIISKSTIFN